MGHLKYDRSEQKRHFFTKLKTVCAIVGKPGAYCMIPKRELELLYMLRDLPFKIEAAPGERVSDEVLRKMRSVHPLLMKYFKVSLKKDGPAIPLYHYHGVASGLRLYLNILEDGEFPGAAGLKEELAEFASFEEGAEEAADLMVSAIELTGLRWSDLKSSIYWLEWKRTVRKYAPFGHTNILLVHSCCPEKRMFTFDGVARPAVKLCAAIGPHGGTLPVKVKPSGTGIPAMDHYHEVYIQMHALNRMDERLNCLDSSINQLDLCESVWNWRAHAGNGGSMLVEHRIGGIKAGYWVAGIADGAVIIRTFLFITNGGTPEGRKLQELSGIKRLDREFLGIDKLSTFVSSDIKSNKDLESLFREAGCECLFELRDRVEMRKDENLASTLPLLSKYFGVGSKGDFMTPDPVAMLRKKLAADDRRAEE